MLNYSNLNDVEFEYLCQDIMQQKLGVELKRFAQGKDGGIDLTDNVISKNIVVQAKCYKNSTTTQLMASLKKEVEKVKELNPNSYYICCSKQLTPQKIEQIYTLFKDYMQSSNNIITLNEIDDFLTCPENIEILKKHYKLWIESTGILQDLSNNDIFIDCEVLLSNIQAEQSLFVQTSAYYKALECLEHNKSLFITGNPGVGKTVTSKMLALYYAANGYRVRYTTNGSDLGSLKKSLSRNPETKEIVLVDDCFGQAYFQMKESQNEELLSLIKYINMSQNKLMILNSRVTIFQEAKERKPELVRSLENKEYKVFVIDMTALSDVEKAKIFYNHLAFNNIPQAYFNEIKKNKRYREIIKHPNYNPRLIEFICSPSRYQDINPDSYYEFIIGQLNNPKQIWKDEYERKLKKADRILLSTIYSLSDKASTQEIVKTCFEKRIMSETDIDTTVNQFEASLLRLMDGFIHIIDERGTKKLSMLNPSVNDYLDGHFSDNVAERKTIIDNSVSIRQLRRLLKPIQFSEYSRKILLEHTVDKYLFDNEKQKLGFICYYISEYEILDECYKGHIHSYLLNPTNLYFGGILEANSIEILNSLLNKKTDDFYSIKQFLLENDCVEGLLSRLELDEMIDMILCIDHIFVDDERSRYIEKTTSLLKVAIEIYFDDVEIDDFDVDIGNAVFLSTYESELGDEVDIDEAVRYIEDELETCVHCDLNEKLQKLPSDISIPKTFLNKLSIRAYGIEEAVESHIEDMHMPDFDDIPQRTVSNETEIDYIFNRE